MIVVVYGTTGELIKLAPVLKGLRERRAQVLTICTGQQVEQIPPLLDDFGLSGPDLWLGRGFRERDLERAAWIAPWLAQVSLAFARRRARLRQQIRARGGRSAVLIHGDTFTTVIGALIGRSLGMPVAHLEAGLRSGNWRHPFPEELDRRAAGHLANIHLAPGAYAVANLNASRTRGDIVNTFGNTINDALNLVPAGPPGIDLPDEPFGLVSLHRFELLGNPPAFRAVIELLRETARRIPLLFIDHPVTAAAIKDQHLDDRFGERFRRIPRLRYFRFIALLKASSFLFTDSGGSQEECAYLGHPCLVHRATTERAEGLGGPVVLSRLSLDVASSFLADPLAHSCAPQRTERRPTDVVLDYFERRGFIEA